MKQFVDIVVVIPVGPDSNALFVADTINSYIHYTKCSYKLILADDSHQGIGIKVRELIPAIDIIYTSKPMGGWAGLYITLSRAFKHALDNFEFKALLKLDTDALVIGAEPEAEALELFKSNPNVGMAGQYPLDYNNKPWDVCWPRRRILNSTTTWKFLRRPYGNWSLRKLYYKALSNGYRTGESVFGGAYFMNSASLVKLMEEGLLPHDKLRFVNLGEDHLFSLLIKSVGLNFGSLSSKEMPFACAWNGLPASPEQLHHEGKKIIHSTRFWKNMQETEIRDWFYKRRSEVPLPGLA